MALPPPTGDSADYPSESPGPVLVQEPPAPAPPPVTRGTIWVMRLYLLIKVVFCIELGMLLVIIPWQRVWTENTLLVGWPAVRDFLAMDFVRGAVTGLGLLDIWIGLWEAVHYRDPM